MKHGTEGSIAQVPKTVCTFTDLRKLYLRPDARTDHHPQEVTNPVYPNPTSTAIIPGIAVVFSFSFLFLILSYNALLSVCAMT